MIYDTFIHFYHKVIIHQLQKVCQNFVPISSDLSVLMKPQLNVSFYSAVGLIEKIYLNIFPDLSENVQEKCIY